MQHAQLILGVIQLLLKESQLALSDLDVIAYGCGPGSFTGVRIANSVAQGLGFAHQKPLIPISSMAALAQTLFMREACLEMLVAIDARMQQVYWSRYRVSNGLTVECQLPEQLLYLSEVPDCDRVNSHVAVGDGWGKYSSELSATLKATPSLHYPDELVHATALLPLAQQYYKEGKMVTPDQALPVYLR